MGKTAYLLRSIQGLFAPERLTCPNCGHPHALTVARKYLVTRLRRCGRCELLFRVPTDDPAKNRDYYEHEYSQGITTEMPSDEFLTALLRENFAGSEKDWTYYNRVLRSLGLIVGARVFDFGCSWGYGSYQMSAAGYSVVAFDVAPTRRRFARDKLGVAVVEDPLAAVSDLGLAGTFDCFFTAHVLEHLPKPCAVFDLAAKLLRPGGLFVSFTPNGCEPAKALHPEWNKWWGEVHPNMIDDRFLDRAFEQSPRVVGSSPVGEVQLPPTATMWYLNDLSGSELFFAARA